MSVVSFIEDISTLKYIYKDQIDYLLEKHRVKFEDVSDAMLKLGWEKGRDREGNEEYWKEIPVPIKEVGGDHGSS